MSYFQSVEEREEATAGMEILAEKIVEKIANNILVCLPLKAGWNRMGFQKRKVVLHVWKALVFEEMKKGGP